MKNAILFFWALCSTISTLAQTPSVSADEAAIKEVIINETTAWANRDSIAFLASYADDALTQGTWNNPDGSYGFYKGFSAIKASSSNIKNQPKKMYEPQVERTDWVINMLSNEWAYVNYNEKITTVKKEIFPTYETRLMKKVGGKWKIVAMQALWDYKNAIRPTEQDDIKQVIVDETNYWIDGNFDKWQAAFVQEPYLLWSVTNGGEPGDVLTMRGWAALKTFMEGWFKNYNADAAKKMRRSDTTRDNWQIQIRGNVAYLSYNQHSVNADTKQVLDSTETRVLERINGTWKIAMQSTLADFKDAVPPIKSKY